MVQRDCSANRLNVSARLTSSCSMDPARRPEHRNRYRSRTRLPLPRRARSSGWSPRLSRRPQTVPGRSPGRIHALMPPGTAGDRRCVRYLRDRLLSSVLNHTPGPLLSATERRAMTLNCRPREAGTGRRRRAPRLPADRDPHPAEPLHTGRLAADAARWWGMRQGATLPTCPNCNEPELLLNLLREANQKGPLRERTPP